MVARARTDAIATASVSSEKGRSGARGLSKEFPNLIKDAVLASTTAASKPTEIWFGDEARVGQKGTHAYVWAPIGSRPTMVRDTPP
jgi:hypothetical protein